MSHTTITDTREFTAHSVPPAATSDVPDNIRVFASGMFESAGPALTTVLNRTVTVTEPDVVLTTPAALLAAEPLPWVLAEVAYQRGLNGRHWVILPLASAVALAGGAPADGGAEAEIDAGMVEAVREAVNQIFTAAGPTLMPLFARSVAFGPANVTVVEDMDRVPTPLRGGTEALWLIRAHAESPDGLAADFMVVVEHALGAEIAALGAHQEPVAPVDNRPPSKLDMVLDVSLPVTVELGRARMQIQDILKLVPGSVIELDRSAGDPVELLINDRPIAKGEVVIIDENFGVRLTSIVTATERIKTLR